MQLYEDIQDFWVADDGGRVVGCGALHPLWEDLAEIRTVAVDPSVRGRGVGHLLVTRLVETARELGVARVFVLTFEVDVLRAARLRADRGRAGHARRLRGATALVRRGRRRVPRPGAREAEHARQHAHAAAPLAG